MADVGSMSYQEALNLCLDEMAGATTTPFVDGVRELLHKGSLPKFKANHHLWSKYHTKVTHAARYIGSFAALYADFDASPRITEIHARRAVAAVKQICAAVKDDPKLAWCPDFPATS